MTGYIWDDSFGGYPKLRLTRWEIDEMIVELPRLICLGIDDHQQPLPFKYWAPINFLRSEKYLPNGVAPR